MTIEGDILSTTADIPYSAIRIHFDDDSNLAVVFELRESGQEDWQRVSVNTPDGPSYLFKDIVIVPSAAGVTDPLVSFEWVRPAFGDTTGIVNEVVINALKSPDTEMRFFVTPTWDAGNFDYGQSYSYDLLVHSTFFRRL